MTEAKAASDPLSDVVELARREGALEGEGLLAFVDALRARARLLLGEREQRLRAVEAESAWRQEAMATLEASVRALESEAAWRREAMQGLEQSVRALGDQAALLAEGSKRAAQAHGALLDHHRQLVERVAAELAAVAALSPLRVREARHRLLALAEQLRGDSK